MEPPMKPLFTLLVPNPRNDIDVLYSLYANMPVDFTDMAGSLDISIRWNDERTAAECVVSQPAEAQ
jgi:hypothetical protein